MIPEIDRISPDYRKAQSIMHRSPRGYGSHGDYWAATVIEVARRYDVGSILDYGAGQCRLGIALRESGFNCSDYDPAIKGINSSPSFADLVTCCDVLEHCEPDKLENVLAHIKMLARKAVFLVISCRPAERLLPDGHNAHLIIQPKAWWRERLLQAGFTVAQTPTTLPEKMPRACWMGVVIP